MKSVQNYRTTILTAILILFTNNFTVLGQINGKIDGEISESGIFIKDITLSYSPENTDIDIVKSKLIDHHLEQGWDIYEETNNKISFSKKLEGFEGALVMWLFMKVISVLKIGSEFPF